MNFLKITRLFLFILAFPAMAQHTDPGPVIGVSVMHVSDEKAEVLGLPNDEGVMLRTVWRESPADQAGLRPLDYIVQVNDKPLDRRNDLSDILSDFEVGEEVELTYWRGGEQKTSFVDLADPGKLERNRRKGSEDPFLGIGQRHDEIPDGINGIAINPTMNSTAWAMGLQKGDIITRIDDYPIVDWHDAEGAIDAREVGDDITLVYWRDGNLFTQTRPIKSFSATHNNSSRHDGMRIEENTEEPDAVQAEVQIEVLSETDVQQLEKEMEEEMPAIVDLQVKELKIFPNPTNGIFDIQFELPQRAETFIRIFGSDGRQIYFNELGNFSGTFSDRIDIANNARGVYFLELRQEGKAEVRRVVLQ